MICNWPLGNGEALQFEVLAKNEGWNAIAGLYIFAYQLQNGNWQAVYIGQTDNFSLRMPNHDRLDAAVRAGATHIHAKVVNSQQNRDLWESMLIRNLQPQLNQHHR
jgi:hypothetical protein